MYAPRKYFTTGEVAARLGMPRWKLAYLVERGALPGPHVQVPGRRLFTPEDVDRIRRELAKRDTASPDHVAPTAAEGRVQP